MPIFSVFVSTAAAARTTWHQPRACRWWCLQLCRVGLTTLRARHHDACPCINEKVWHMKWQDSGCLRGWSRIRCSIGRQPSVAPGCVPFTSGWPSSCVDSCVGRQCAIDTDANLAADILQSSVSSAVRPADHAERHDASFTATHCHAARRQRGASPKSTGSPACLVHFGKSDCPAHHHALHPAAITLTVCVIRKVFAVNRSGR